MKKSLIVVSLILVISMLSVGVVLGQPFCQTSSTAQTQCTDSDQGKNYFVKGCTKGTDEEGVNDYCEHEYSVGASDKSLVEFYCSENKRTYIQYSCPYSCKDGACLGQGLPVPQCTDSDPKDDYYIKGYIITEENIKSADECKKDVLLQYHCDPQNPGTGLGVSYTCPYGCIDGVCCKQGDVSCTTCIDSDQGKNYYTKGESSGFYELYDSFTKMSDSCIVSVGGNMMMIPENLVGASFYLGELYCDGKKLKVESYMCQNGCKDGRCCQKNDASCDVSCKDSDNGINYPVKGKSSGIYRGGGEGGFKEVEDYCMDEKGNSVSAGNTLVDFYCEEDEEEGTVYLITNTLFGCDCKNGVCPSIKTPTTGKCTENDQGKSYFVKGETCIGNECKSDSCEDGDILIEYYCTSKPIGPNPNEGVIKGASEKYTCPQGCQDGACMGGSTEPTTELVACETNQCELNGNCYPIGYRKGGNYCSDIGWTVQKTGEESCDNNFECSSNVCVDGNCISAGLVRRMVNWFKGLFGY